MKEYQKMIQKYKMGVNNMKADLYNKFVEKLKIVNVNY